MTTSNPALDLRTLLRLAVALSLAGTAACIQIDAELPDICKTAEFTYNGAQPAGLTTGQIEETVDFVPQELADVLTQLKLKSGTVSVTPAGAVDELKMVLRPATGSTEFDLTLLHLRPVGEGGPIPNSQADLLPYVGGQMVFQLTGTPPSGTTFSVSVCASARATKTFKLQSS